MTPNFALPTSTYRLQLHAGFTFDDAAAQLPYLERLGITHVFCSPILQATPGSMHGYDVVDHSRISAELGGEDAFRRLSTTAHKLGLGVVVDVVPNHMAVPTPLFHNHALWEVLREGADSPFAHWFDVDLTSSRAILMPVLGRRIGEELADGTIGLETRAIPGPDGTTTSQPVVVHHDHVFPVCPGTEHLPLDELLDAQWYRLAFWRVAGEELNYRRFFDVDTLAAVRVEDADVFAATHTKLLELYADSAIDAFRIDHPDGLANPRAYLADLAAATIAARPVGDGDGAWVVAEKILEGHETLPECFDCAGTTGYDALLRVAGVFQDPAALPQLNVVWERTSGSGDGFATTLERCKEEIVSTMLIAEVNRLTSIALAICDDDISRRDHTRGQLHRAISALLVSMDRYRAYVEPGEAVVAEEADVIAAAADRARFGLTPDEQLTLDLVVALACGDPGSRAADGGAETLPAPGDITLERPGNAPEGAELRAEFMVRFAQTCGPIMAKSKEDTAFYRWNRFAAVNEVGSEPTRVGISPDAFHDFADHLTRVWPATMTTLSTHDTKRSEDVRARLTALLDHPAAWETCLADLRAATDSVRGELVDGATEVFCWQTLVGTWRLPGTAAAPISEDRLLAYLTKAMREAKTHTTWTAPNELYEQAILELASFALTDDACAVALDTFTSIATDSVRTAILGQKLLQLTMPGVPDLYQGCELVDLSLVDPDNRRPVDFEARAALLDYPIDSLDAEKLRVTSTALRLRREHPDAFRGTGAEYRPVATTSGHALAFARGLPGDPLPIAITVVTRLPAALAERGGWGDHTVVLPVGRFRDALTGREVAGGETPLAELLTDLPVALLVPVSS